MFLSSLQIQNFRCFDEQLHTISFNKGLTILVGENDSGKSTVMDAIRLVMGTTDFNWHRIEPNDFHKEDTSREIRITCKFSDLSTAEQAAFLECLTYEKKQETALPYLYLHWTCKYATSFNPPRAITNLSSGLDCDGPTPTSEARELLRATYLKALRDANSDMQSGRHSRLSQIIHSIPNLTDGENEYSDGMDLHKLSLVGIANLSNNLLASHPILSSINNDMSQILNKKMLLKQDMIKTKFEVSDSKNKDVQKINALLEKLDLSLDKDETSMQGNVGLGTSNILSMACELLLNKKAEENKRSSFLLIEEPEAHIHAQRQLKLIKSLEESATSNAQQIIITTHSPLVASVVDLENVIILKDLQAYSLANEKTMLEKDDYWFLEKYLDATKANLFFARSVMIVEGPGEALLLPELATLLGKSFTDYGVSLVDVRGVGLCRYARIFQRKDGNVLNINVACVTDRDVMPNCAPHICLDYTNDPASWPDKNKRNWRAEADFQDGEADQYLNHIRERADGQNVKTFVANHWTLEYDLAFAGLQHSKMYNALVEALIKVSYVEKNRATQTTQLNDKLKAFGTIEEKASYFYSFFTHKKASKANFAQQLSYELSKAFKDDPEKLQESLPRYLVDAISYVVKE